MSEKAARAGIHYSKTRVHCQIAACVTRQSREAHKIRAVQNTINVLSQIFSGILLPKIIEISAQLITIL